MPLLDRLSDRDCWESFYEYKDSLCCPKQFCKELREFIDSEGWLEVCRRIKSGEEFALPKRSVISKQDSRKKRVIYTYPKPENTVLKLLTFLLLRRYDGIFPEGLYSFRPGRTAQQGFLGLARTPGIGNMWSYKADISNYFNSVDISLLLPVLKDVTGDDPELYGFLSSLLLEKRVTDKGQIITDDKGIMAGTPTAAFYANLFLCGLDEYFAGLGIPYARYSDDIILFTDTRAEAEEHAGFIHRFLSEKGLVINPDKESITPPGGNWTFLGLSFCGGKTDIAPASVSKLKAKMRRKTRALMRWQQRNGLAPESAAKAFIRIFERKLFETRADNELTWAYWYFPVITTDASLKVLDSYAQDCLRVILSGKHTKSRYNIRYSRLKELGYRSLVNEYYRSKRPQTAE
ncbi:MAG: hypothetical protein IKO27_02700 [Ruminococcus sp.]|nr:hypothetical protein [Ruminococcus sp.]